MPTSQPISCPKCGQSDRSTPATQAGIAPPPQPSGTLLTIVKVIRWIFGIFYGLAVFMLLAVIGGGLLLGGAATLFGSQYDPYGTTTTLFGLTIIPLLCGGFMLIFVLILMGAFTIGLPWLIHRLIKQNYEQKNIQWQRARGKYEHLHYCARCAGVFLEGQERVIPVESLQAFLYEIQAPSVL
jgi:hypothetical protein